MAKKSSVGRRVQKQRKGAEHGREQVAQRRSETHSQTRVGALNPFEPMERLAKAFVPFGWFMPWLDIRMPKMDVIDHLEEVVVKAELPGVDKKALNVEVGDNSVTIEGSTHEEATEERSAYYRSEITRGTFSRTVTLPVAVDGSKAKADFKDGMLIVTLPKLNKPGGVKVGRID